MPLNYREFNDHCSEQIEKGVGKKVSDNLSRHFERSNTRQDISPDDDELSKKVLVNRWRDFQLHENLLIDLENEIKRTAIWARGGEDLHQIIKKDIYNREAKHICVFRSGHSSSVSSRNITALQTIKIQETSLGRTFNEDHMLKDDNVAYPIVSSDRNEISDFYQNKYGYNSKGVAENILKKHYQQNRKEINDCDYIILEAAFAVSDGGLFGFYDSDAMLIQLLDRVGKGIIVVDSSTVTATCESIDDYHYMRARNRTGNQRYPQLLLLRGSGILKKFTVVVSDDINQPNKEYLNNFYFSEQEQKKFYDPLFLSVGSVLENFSKEEVTRKLLTAEFYLLDGWGDRTWPYQGEQRKRTLMARHENVVNGIGAGFMEKVLLLLWKKIVMKRKWYNKLGSGFLQLLVAKYFQIFGSDSGSFPGIAGKSFNRMWIEKNLVHDKP